MELRSSPRRAVTLYTMLDYHSLGLVRGCVRDIGLGGMFVDIGRIQLPVNATLRASLMIGPSDLRQPVHVDAVVVRCAEHGVGLMFDELDSEFRYTLNRLIRGCLDPAREGDCPDFLH
ncbi:MAG: PilZ domain-containing protein [Sedimenticola sp.]|nr:PilZ domain-containing protein [Sedimenticola sp.]